MKHSLCVLLCVFSLPRVTLCLFPPFSGAVPRGRQLPPGGPHQLPQGGLHEEARDDAGRETSAAGGAFVCEC